MSDCPPAGRWAEARGSKMQTTESADRRQVLNLGDERSPISLGLLGDLFFRWAASSAEHRRVSLIPHPDPDHGYYEFPSDQRLEGFDRARRS